MKMICDVPNEVIKNVRMGTWCGSSIVEKMIANGIPLEQLRAKIEQLSTTTCTETRRIYIDTDDFKENVLEILDKYKADRETLADIYKPTLKADLCIMDEFAFDPQEESEEE